VVGGTCDTGACCRSTPNGIVCDQRSVCACSQAGGTFKGAGQPCDLCADAVFSKATIIATAEFGSVSVSCSGLSGGFISQLADFPCGFSYGSAPNGGNFPTSNRIVVDVRPSACNQFSTPTATRGCDTNSDVSDSSNMLSYNVSVRTSRRDGWGNVGITEEREALFNILFNGSSATVSTVQKNAVGVGVGDCGRPTRFSGSWIDLRYKRCLPCGFHAVSDNRFTCGVAYQNNAAQTDCCSKSLDASLQVVLAP
jgi:hypothetical protein